MKVLTTIILVLVVPLVVCTALFLHDAACKKLPVHLEMSSSETAKDLLGAATGYTENLVNLAMAVMGATATLAYKLFENGSFRKRDEFLVTFIFAVLGCSVWFGKLGIGTLLDMFSSSGSLSTSGGPFDVSNHFQMYCLLLGTTIFLLFLLWRPALKMKEGIEL